MATWRGNQKGMTLLEAIISVAILGMTAIIGVGTLERAYEQAAARAVAGTFRSLVAEATLRSVTERLYVGIVFSEEEKGVAARLYADGDGDGIQSEDIRRGTDIPLSRQVILKADRARLGIPPAVSRDPEGNPLPPDDPVRFGRASILSFGPTATATPGSLYIQGNSGREVWAFRVAGLGGRVRVFRWFRGKWEAVGG